MPPLSADQFMPHSDEPKDIRAAVERQALWIERQSTLNKTHWDKIIGFEGDCKDCRGDRRLADSMVLERLNIITQTLEALQADKRWTVLVVRGLFALTTLLVAAKAVGVLK